MQLLGYVCPSPCLCPIDVAPTSQLNNLCEHFISKLNSCTYELVGSALCVASLEPCFAQSTQMKTLRALMAAYKYEVCTVSQRFTVHPVPNTITGLMSNSVQRLGDQSNHAVVLYIIIMKISCHV